MESKKQEPMDTMQHRINMLNYFKKEYQQYIENKLCVYKLCMKEWIVILTKISTTIDNQSRNNIVDPLYAKCRASVLYVNVIVNAKTGKTIDSITNVCHYDNKEYTLTYTAKQNIYPDKFDPDLEKVCSSGVHYHTTIDRVFETMELPSDFTGTKIYRNDNGSISYSAQYIYGKTNGLMTIWWDGFKHQEGICINDLKHGIWTEYFRNGNIYCIGEYVDNKKSGQWFTYYESGRKSSVTNYANDLKQGQFYSYWENGAKFYEGMYVDDKEEGIWTTWSDGIRMFGSVAITKGTKIREGKYVNGKKEGKWIEWWSDKTVKREGNYINGKEEGEWKVNDWYVGTFGLKYLYGKGYYKNGKKEDVWNEWYDKNYNRKASGGTYVNGEKEGEWWVWYGNGKLSCHGTFKKGYRDGEWLINDKNGRKKTSGVYRKSEKYGNWTKWNKNGSIKSIDVFHDLM